MYHILIVEDDAAIAAALARHLSSWGFEPRTCEDFSRVMETFLTFDPHLTLMDLALPVQDGYSLCQQIRRVSKTPVIFLSSAGDNLNIVTAMTLGADDFIVKPFDPAVLHAHLLAQLRRAYDFSAAPDSALWHGASLCAQDAALILGQTRLPLTRNEFRILSTLLSRRGQVVSRETLMERLWETDSFVDENTLSVNINRLRRKLEPLGLSSFIVTRKGLGYAAE